ncbi:hypothetical protein L249_1555 [Ophiocordyceps polyrhachis-furcata BCC 54312]|uniref:Uncharacterized protein n=1 Tax=Ophiocordyceps polyrhachis-furcata BCC 54312 TaxID=1330021 RepID=A0A367L4H4_9HYPO|nr:hypothetical protein L249_1555 [Ophiocordyceps polyrhachis-furcata BCC 54312]
MNAPSGQGSSSGLPGSDPTGQSSSAYNSSATPPFYSHPARISALSPDGRLLLGSPTGFSVARRAEGSNMDASASDDILHVWNVSGSLPSFSRAFDMFTQSFESESSTQGCFFVPSYLRGTTYIKRLQEAYRSKSQALREPQRPLANGGTAFTQLPLTPGAHRGLAHTIVERTPAPEEDEQDAAVAPLPSRWNKDDAWHGIDLQPDDLSVKYTGPKNNHERDHEASATRADHHMPPQCGLYYYEVQILSGKHDDTTIAIGFSTKDTSLSRPVGWEPDSWGYHGDDGRCFSGQNIGRSYGPTFNTGDIIGCGVNFRENSAFFTKNGVKLSENHRSDTRVCVFRLTETWSLGVAFHEVVRGKLYPSVSLKKPGEAILVNFGQVPFVYNIDDVMREERKKMQQEISNADTTKLEPGMSETDLIQTLVLQFLQHDGYVETARAFAEDMRAQRQALSLDPTAEVAGINIKDEEDANNRQRIRKAILEGDIDRALKYTNAYYPQVLQDNEEVYFRLRCRKFIEMVCKAAHMRAATESRRNNSGHEMDIDGETTGWSDSMDTDGPDQTELIRLEQDMLEFGQALEAQYANDQRKDVSQTLGEIWALVAYSNPLKEPLVSHLLDRKGRAAVAEELNSAILTSLGKSSRASLERVYAQTSVLLEDLRRKGGPGAFVSLQDLLEEIAQAPQA